MTHITFNFTEINFTLFVHWKINHRIDSRSYTHFQRQYFYEFNQYLVRQRIFRFNVPILISSQLELSFTNDGIAITFREILCYSISALVQPIASLINRLFLVVIIWRCETCENTKSLSVEKRTIYESKTVRKSIV